MFSSLRFKAALLFSAIALVPAGLTLVLLLDVNDRAVHQGEQDLQAALVSELGSRVQGEVEAAISDAEAIAATLGEAAKQPGAGDGLGAVRALVATRKRTTGARFEVPEAKVDTVLAVAGGSAPPPPASTAALRAIADARGVALALGADARGIIVVPIRAAGLATKGYVTLGLELAPLEGLVTQLASERLQAGARILVVDGDKRAVVAHGLASVETGADVSALPIWSALPEGIPWDRPLGVVNEFDESGEAMVGTVRTLSTVGWAVALWRPQAQAYATLDAMRRSGGLVTIGSLLLALIAGVLAARAVTAPVLAAAAQAPLIASRRWREVALASTRKDELGELVRAMGRMASDLEAGEAEIARETKLRTDLGRFLSKELVESIVRGNHDLALGGKRMMVTVLFADIVAFTPLAESRPAEYVVSLLNELFSVMSEVVFRHGGMIDKFIGDCLMAVWGAPVADPSHASHALAAAEDMMRFLETAAIEWREKYGVEIRLGVGVNSGEVIVGNIGSDKRMEYTVVGDAVNVAARLEAIARPNQVLVGETTFDLVKGEFAMQLLGERKLTGRQKESKVYELETA